MSKQISTEELDRLFDEGEDIMKYADLSKARRHNREKESVEIELPAKLVDKVDEEAKDGGVSRREVIARVLNDYFQKAAM